MAERDGNGWALCGQRHRHWGRHGAAGLLAYAPGSGGRTVVLLQRRAWWTASGGTWGTPGGACDSHETPREAALREAAEECLLPSAAVRITAALHDDHGGWGYHTLIGQAQSPFPVQPASAETSEVAWVPVAEVTRLLLHPGFRDQWPVISRALEPVTIIVDGANVVGARADGWWRDRAGAAVRLHGELAALGTSGLAALPEELDVPRLDRWFPGITLVVEGAARAAAGRIAAGPPAGDGQAVAVAVAEGSGDDTIADLAARLPGRRLVVTADRELRQRCQSAGAAVTGPRWLLGLL